MSQKNIAFDFVHPAQLLFYYWPIKRLEAEGFQCRIFLRKKDVLLQLADSLGLDYHVISSAGSGLFYLAFELIVRDFRLLLACIRQRPLVLVGFGGVAASHVGTVLRIPVLVYYDAEHAKLQNSISYPFVDRLVVPNSYVGPVPEHKTWRFNGTKECSYLSPNHFKIDPTILTKNGFDETKKTVLFRLVSWEANHDVGYSGIDDDTLRRVIEALPYDTQVIISSERDVGDEFNSMIWQGPPLDFHHLVGRSDLVIAEGSTVAHEAALLGTKVIYTSPIVPLVTKHLASLGLIKIFELDQLTQDLLKEQFTDKAVPVVPADWFDLQDQILDHIRTLGGLK